MRQTWEIPDGASTVFLFHNFTATEQAVKNREFNTCDTTLKITLQVFVNWSLSFWQIYLYFIFRPGVKIKPGEREMCSQQHQTFSIHTAAPSEVIEKCKFKCVFQSLPWKLSQVAPPPWCHENHSSALVTQVQQPEVRPSVTWKLTLWHKHVFSMTKPKDELGPHPDQDHPGPLQIWPYSPDVSARSGPPWRVSASAQCVCACVWTLFVKHVSSDAETSQEQLVFWGQNKVINSTRTQHTLTLHLLTWPQDTDTHTNTH